MIKLIISLILIYYSSYGWARHIPHSNCSWSKPEGVTSIGMIGDSLISYPRCSKYSGCDYEKETALSHFLSEKFNTTAICDKSNGGDTADKIKYQYLSYKPDILIIGGGNMDFLTCPSKENRKIKGKTKECMEEKLDQYLTKDLSSGLYVDLIDKYANKNTQVIIMYTTWNSPFAERKGWKTIERLILPEYGDRMTRLAETSENIHWFDVSKIDADLYDRSNYDPIAGIHPSYKVYEWFAEYIYNLVPR
jgi:hypothetical protein